MAGDLQHGDQFDNFTDAERAVTDFRRQYNYPVRRHKKETFRAANKKFSRDRQFTDVSLDDVYSCRYLSGSVIGVNRRSCAKLTKIDR